MGKAAGMALNWLDEECCDPFSSLLKCLFEVFDDAEAHGVTGAVGTDVGHPRTTFCNLSQHS